MEFGGGFRNDLLCTILVIILLSSCFYFSLNTMAFPLGETMSWDEFLSDHMDKDGDGENDTFLSMDPPERIIVNDLVVSIEDYSLGSLNVSMIIFETNSEPMFFGDALEDSIEPGERVLVEIDVIEGEESDGDRCETYDIYAIWYYEEQDDEDEHGNSRIHHSEQNMPWYGWMLVAGPFIIGCLILYMVYVRPKHRKKEKKTMNTDKPKEMKQTYYCPDCNELLKFKKRRNEWYCRHCKKNHAGLTSSSYDFGVIRKQY